MQHQSDNPKSSQMIMYTPCKFTLTIEPIILTIFNHVAQYLSNMLNFGACYEIHTYLCTTITYVFDGYKQSN